MRILLLVLAVLLVPSPAASAAGPSTARLEAFVRGQLDRAGAPGVAYAVAGPGGAEHVGTAGTDGDGRPVTADTPFLWGSVAKPVAARVTRDLAADGRLALDAPAARYLPGVPGAITIRDLLDHTSGLPADYRLTDRFDAGRRAADVVPSLADLELVSRPGDEHHYSSLNYLVLTAVIERVTGRRYADVLVDRVPELAGVVTDADALPPGHRFVAGQPVALDAPLDPAGAGYGYLGGTVRQLAAFARSSLRDVPAGSVPSGGDTRYGLGWRRWPLADIGDADGTFVWHGGAAPGYQAGIALLPDRDRAVVVLQNAYGPFQETRLLGTTFGLVNLLEGVTPRSAGTEPAYWIALAVGAALVLALLVATARSLRRAAPPTTVGRTAGWLLALGALAYGLAVALPGALAVGLGQLPLWAPDVAALVYAALVLCGLLALARLRLAVGARSRTGARVRSVGQDPAGLS